MTVRRRASRLFPVEERTAFLRPGFLSEKTAQTLANGSELCYTERGKMDYSGQCLCRSVRVRPAGGRRLILGKPGV